MLGLASRRVGGVERPASRLDRAMMMILAIELARRRGSKDSGRA